MCEFYDLPHRVDGAKRVGDMDKCYQFGARAQQLLEFLEDKLTAVIDRDYT